MIEEIPEPVEEPIAIEESVVDEVIVAGNNISEIETADTTEELNATNVESVTEIETTIEEQIQDDDQSESFFDRLFSSNEQSSDTDTQENVEAETITEEQVAIQQEKPEEIITPIEDEKIEVEETVISESLAIRPTIPTSDLQDESAESFNTNEFDSTDSSNVESLDIESEIPIAIQEEVIDESVVLDSETDIAMLDNSQSESKLSEEVLTGEEFLNDSSAETEIPSEETIKDLTQDTDDIAETEDDESSGGITGFFSRLFSSDEAEKAETENDITEEIVSETTEELLIEPIDENLATTETIVEDIQEEPVPSPQDFSQSPYEDNMSIALLQEELGVASTTDEDLSQYNVQTGRRALMETNFDLALDNFTPLAKSGDAKAQNYLGSMYYIGNGVEQDYKQSYNWYRLAAEQGNRDAQYSIGNMYLLGEGVEQDNLKAAYWYQKSSAQGHIAAKQNLENLQKLISLNQENEIAQQNPIKETQDESQLTSINVDSIESESVTLTNNETIEPTNIDIEKSDSSSNFFDSLFGENEETIDLKTETTIQATKEPASEPETEDLKENLIESEVTDTTEQITSNETFVEQEDNFNSEIVSSNDPVIQELMQLSEQGDSKAQYYLAARYYIGDGVERNYGIAADWFKKSAENNYMDAQYSLGNMYLMGEGVSQNDQQAIHWYRQAANQGHIAAQSNLDNLMQTTALSASPEENNKQTLTISEVEVEPETTFTPLEAIDNESIEAPEQIDNNSDDPKQIYDRGLQYAYGEGVDKNNEAAFELLLQAANLDYAPAQYKVAIAYAYGDGVEKDMQQAADWYLKAAEKGHMIAQRNLATLYLSGKGIEQDKIKAMAWYQIIADSGNPMDIQRRDKLQSELSEPELEQSEKLASQISQRISNTSSL